MLQHSVHRYQDAEVIRDVVPKMARRAENSRLGPGDIAGKIGTGNIEGNLLKSRTDKLKEAKMPLARSAHALFQYMNGKSTTGEFGSQTIGTWVGYVLEKKYGCGGTCIYQAASRGSAWVWRNLKHKRPLLDQQGMRGAAAKRLCECSRSLAQPPTQQQ